ncbi:Cyclin-dependent [Fagus crenata]
MPLGFQVLLGLDLKDFNIYLKIWSKCASGQIATSIGCFHSRKFLTGGFSSLEIFFWFPLLIALSGQLSNELCRRRNASFF